MSMLSNRIGLLASVALFAAVHTAPAVAADYCVASVAELRTATAAAALSAEDDLIRLVRGDYALDAALDANFEGSIVLRGGYAAGCPFLAVRSLDASQTRITSSPAQLAGVDFRPREDLELDGLSFEDLRGVQVFDQGGAPAIEGRILVRRSRFLGNAYGLNVNSRSKDVRIENNLFRDNVSLCCASDVYNYALAVRHTNANSSDIALNVLFNTVLGSPKGLVIQGGGPFASTPVVQNNILRSSASGAGTFALKLDAVDVEATNNVWGAIETVNGGTLEVNLLNVDADPVLDAGFAPAFGSPARNSGTDLVPGGVPSTDYDGGPRVIGTLPDRGAIESAFSDIGVLTVTSAANSGAGTLRQAILDSNLTSNAEVIRFNLGTAGGCPYTITPTSLLPTIVSPLTIDGYSQPGSAPNTESSSDDAVRCVVVSGSVAQGLRLQPPADRQVKVSGIAFYGFTTSAVEVQGDGFAVIEGNGFGTGASVLASDFAGDAIVVDGADGTRIGGEDNAQRNLIGRASGAGVRLLGGTGREVRNNFIGLSANGYGTVANGVGIHVTDGAGDLLDDNDIGHNDAQGILIDGAASASITMSRNQIGRSPTRNPNPSIGYDVGNGSNGIRVTTGIGHEIASNRVVYNGTDGIVVLTDAVARINANRIYDNAQLGIDLSPNGVDDQNPDDQATGRGNRGQNYPVLATAIGTNSEGVVTGTLPSYTGEFEIQLFASNDCDESDHGEGEAIIGTTNVEIGGIPVDLGGGIIVEFPINGSVSFSAPVSNLYAAFGLVGKYITATATRQGTNSPTSEFSACIPYAAGPAIFGDGFEADIWD